METGRSEEGILSERMTQKRKEIVKFLKTAYFMELETVMNYFTNSINPDGIRAQEVKEALEQDIQKELGHARQLASRIKELNGVVPGSTDFKAEQSSLQPPDEQTDVVHVVKGVIDAEIKAIQHYTRIVAETEEADPVTQDIPLQLDGDTGMGKR
jgi:bacterioferritin